MNSPAQSQAKTPTPETFRCDEVLKEIRSEAALQVLRPGLQGNSAYLTDHKLSLPYNSVDIMQKMSDLADNIQASTASAVADAGIRENGPRLRKSIEVGFVDPDSASFAKVLSYSDEDKVTFNAALWNALSEKSQGARVELKVLINIRYPDSSPSTSLPPGFRPSGKK